MVHSRGDRRVMDSKGGDQHLGRGDDRFMRDAASQEQPKWKNRKPLDRGKKDSFWRQVLKALAR